MKRLIICFVAGLFLPISLAAQCPDQWVQHISPLPGGNLAIDFPKLIVDSMGNVVVCSGIRNADYIITDGQTFSETSASGANSDFFLAKYDATGVIIWLKTFIGVGNNTPIDIDVDGLGNIYICGLMSASMTIDGTLIDRNGSTQPGYFILKLTPNGVLEWVQKSNMNGSRCSALHWTGTTLAFAVAYSDSVQIDSQVFYTGNQDVAHNQDIVFGSMDSDGSFISSFNIGGTGNVDVRSMECDSDKCVLQGRFDRELIANGTVLTTPAVDHNSLYQLSINHDGTVNWAHGSTNSSELNVRPNGLGFTDDGHALFSVNYWYSSMSIGGYDIPAPEQSDIIIGKLRLSDGEILWLKKANGSSYENSGDLITENGTTWLGGTFYSSSLAFEGYDIDKMGAGEHDGFVLSIDADGKPRCGFSIYGSGTATVWSMARATNNHVVTIVEFSGSIDFAGQTYMATGTYDLLVIKTCLPCDTLTSIVETANTIPTLHIHPNPASQSIRLQASGHSSQPKGITITDMLGKTVMNLQPGALNLELDISPLPTGIYTVSAQLMDGPVLRSRLVVQR